MRCAVSAGRVTLWAALVALGSTDAAAQVPESTSQVTVGARDLTPGEVDSLLEFITALRQTSLRYRLVETSVDVSVKAISEADGGAELVTRLRGILMPATAGAASFNEVSRMFVQCVSLSAEAAQHHTAAECVWTDAGVMVAPLGDDGGGVPPYLKTDGLTLVFDAASLRVHAIDSSESILIRDLASITDPLPLGARGLSWLVQCRWSSPADLPMANGETNFYFIHGLRALPDQSYMFAHLDFHRPYVPRVFGAIYRSRAAAATWFEYGVVREGHDDRVWLKRTVYFYMDDSHLVARQAVLSDIDFDVSETDIYLSLPGKVNGCVDERGESLTRYSGDTETWPAEIAVLCRLGSG